MSDAGGARAYVSGAGRGIGRAVALTLAERGADVAIGYLHRDDAAQATAADVAELGRRAILVRGDVGDDPAGLVDEAAGALGGLDVFVACAVEAVQRPILELTAEDWERTMRVNAVNPVAPGPTATEAFDAMAGGEAAALRGRLASITPMGRMGEPTDAARLVAFLCSPEAGWVTGQLIFSDGGYSLV